MTPLALLHAYSAVCDQIIQLQRGPRIEKTHAKEFVELQDAKKQIRQALSDAAGAESRAS